MRGETGNLVAYATERLNLWKNYIYKLLNVPRKLVRLIEIFLNGSRGRIRVNGGLSEEFSIRDGLKQGDALSCMLFNLVLEYVVRQIQTNSAGATLNGIIQILGYADDLYILGDDKETVVKNAEILIAKVKDIGNSRASFKRET